MNRKTNKSGNVLKIHNPTSGKGKVQQTPFKSQLDSSKERKQAIPGRKSSAPVKKIPNIHSSSTKSPGQGEGMDPQVWRQLVQERQRNKILQLEVERLRKSLEICKKTVKEKNNEIEQKNQLINKLIEDKTRIESTQGVMEEDIDIDNLLHANLGEVDLRDILNFTNSVFPDPDDLENLDFTNLVSADQNLSLYPSSLRMATNTAYVVEEEATQLPNREGSTEEEQTTTSEVKGVVGRMVEQRRSLLSAQEEKMKQKVSPIKILRGGNQYKLASRKRSKGQGPPDITPCKLPKLSGKVLPSAPQCLSCPHCDKKFPLGGQWKLTRHISSVHASSKNFSCKYCDNQFPTQSILTAHTQWHKVTNPWQCEKCGYRLGSLTQFVKHVKSEHGVSNLASARGLLVAII